MNDKEYAKQKARIQKFLEKWQDRCGFNWWSITHTFNRLPHDNHPGAAGVTTTQWQYRNVSIEWMISEIIGLTDDQVEECVVHELCHILLGTIEDYGDEMKDRHELAVTNVERAMQWAYKAGVEDAKV